MHLNVYILSIFIYMHGVTSYNNNNNNNNNNR